MKTALLPTGRYCKVRWSIFAFLRICITFYVGPQIGMNPKPILGLPDLETDSGSPRSDMGIAFLVFFFQSRTRLAYLRQSRLRCAAAATAAAATTAATAAATAGCHASYAATASNSSSCHLLFLPHPPPFRLLVASVVAPNPDDDDNDDDDDDDDDDGTVSAASTATTTAARVCHLRDWASCCPSIIFPSSLSSLMSSSLSQPRLRTPPHWFRRDS